ncbi:CcmD family protein [Rhizosphaericola mali]|uniref:CcmD family protein n=1 Tax=Rhizosphaericola mali TaxID=2545455 RepID=A0A5P2FYF0_9BACT|nr:CcmD family protein [Rhizosphaericola mali]QES88205.1 CcmD family protein [Rhizosphaericola mali]
MKFQKIILAILCSFITFSSLFAQAAASASGEKTDFMNSNGKIFVVMAVVVVIILGLFIYLFSLDKKLSRLEDLEKGK